MKKSTKLMTFALVAIMLISAFMIFTSAVDCIIYDAATVMANGTTSDNFKAVLSKDETGDFVKVTSTKSGTKTYFRFDPVKNDLVDADFVPEFKFSDYPVVVVRYRTNISTKNDETALNAGLKIAATGAYERCWDMKMTMINDGQWRKMIKDVREFVGYDGGHARADGVASDSGIRYIRIPIWAYSTGAVDIKTEYFDIQWIGFFKTVEDAENYGGRDPETKKYVITYKKEDGTVIQTNEIAEKAVYTLITAPEVTDKKFVGWKSDTGEMVKVGTYPALSDATYVATYETDYEKIAAREREEAIALGKAAGKVETHTPFIKGYDGFLFKPDNNMTRAEACTVITRLLVDEATVKGKYTSAFSDVEKGAWYYDNVAYLESLGYLKSYSGKFEPDKNITRAEFVELVYAMGKVKADPNNMLTFSDVPTTHPRYEVIMAGASAGLVSGRPGGIFDPDGTIKRSEVVKVLCAALGRKSANTSFDDIVVAGFNDITPAHWAYPYVMESAFEHTTVPNNDGTEIWLTVNDENNYLVKAPDGLIDKLEAEFERRKNAILATKSEWTVAPGNTVWYVSYSEGANTNDGKSPETPWKTISKLDREMKDGGLIKDGDVILFKRGDEWHDKVELKRELTLSAYGEGAKPRILASTEADDAEDWKETEIKGVYVYKYSVKANKDVGNIVFNDGECYGMRVIPYNGKTLPAGSDDLVSNGINTWLFPPRDFKGIETLAEIANDIPEADLMYWHDRAGSKVYLYSRTGNPGDRFESVELCTRGNAISVGRKNNVTIDNLCIKYTGSHGVGAGSCKNLTVRNCEVGWIGGSLQNDVETVRYGNAIEIYGSADGYYVYNNYCYQCFDCGPTVQWQGTLNFGDSVIEKDVLIYDNVLREASLEVWLSTSQENNDSIHAELINCRMYNNMVTGSGTGFKAYNHQKYEWCSFYGATSTKAPYTDCYMENNYFWGEERHLLKAVPTSVKDDNGFVWRGNVIIHPYGEGSIGFLGQNPADATGAYTQYFYDEDTVNMLVKTGAFGVNKFYYTDGSSDNKRLAKNEAKRWYDSATNTVKPIS